VRAEQCSARPVVFAEDGAVDVVEAVARHQPVPTGGTGEALEVVDVSLSPHDHLASGDGLAASAARSTVTEEPDVIIPAEDHASLAVAGGADLAQLGLAAGALEAARVPVALHGEEQEAVGDAPAAARTGAHRCPRATAPRHRHRRGLHPAVHHRRPWRKSFFSEVTGAVGKKTRRARGNYGFLLVRREECLSSSKTHTLRNSSVIPQPKTMQAT